MSLYLKYRPKDFTSVVGQDHAIMTIKSALQRNAMTHAYLFSGPRGTGKTSLARRAAQGGDGGDDPRLHPGEQEKLLLHALLPKR